MAEEWVRDAHNEARAEAHSRAEVEVLRGFLVRTNKAGQQGNRFGKGTSECQSIFEERGGLGRGLTQVAASN